MHQDEEEQGRVGEGVRLFIFLSVWCCDHWGPADSFVKKYNLGLIQSIGVVGGELRGGQWSKILSLAGAHV